MTNASTLAQYWHDLRTLGDDELMTLLFIEPDRDRRSAILAEIDRRYPPVPITARTWNAIKQTVFAQ